MFVVVASNQNKFSWGKRASICAFFSLIEIKYNKMDSKTTTNQVVKELGQFQSIRTRLELILHQIFLISLKQPKIMGVH